MTIKLTEEANPREMLDIHRVEFRVNCWNVRDGVYCTQAYRMTIKDGMFEKDVVYDKGRWKKWHASKSVSGYDAEGGRGNWRLYGPKQEKLMAPLFTSAQRCCVIVDENKGRKDD
ncbi:Uncharacterised protein [Klebsiella oxytoca]|nr:Uncharacterised protein [Klebsiella oxytoca]